MQHKSGIGNSFLRVFRLTWTTGDEIGCCTYVVIITFDWIKTIFQVILAQHLELCHYYCILYFEPDVVYSAIYHLFQLFIFVFLKTTKCLTVGIFDKYLKKLIYMDLFYTCFMHFDMSTTFYACFKFNFISGHVKGT